MALAEEGKANGGVYAAPGSPEYLGVYRKSLYTDAQSMRNEQDQLEAPVLSQSHDITGISETWWDKSHDCSVGMEAYRLLRRARPGRRVKVLHHVQGRD